MYWSMTPLLAEGDAHLNRAPVQVCDPEVALLWVTNTRGVRGVEGTDMGEYSVVLEDFPYPQ